MASMVPASIPSIFQEPNLRILIGELCCTLLGTFFSKLETKHSHKLLFVLFWTVCDFVDAFAGRRLISLNSISTPIFSHDIDISSILQYYFYSS